MSHTCTAVRVRVLFSLVVLMPELFLRISGTGTAVFAVATTVVVVVVPHVVRVLRYNIVALDSFIVLCLI